MITLWFINSDCSSFYQSDMVHPTSVFSGYQKRHSHPYQQTKRWVICSFIYDY